METIYFEEKDIRTGSFEYIPMYEAMNRKYSGMLKANVNQINLIHKDRNVFIEIVFKRDIGADGELKRELYNLDFIIEETDLLFDSANGINYNANLFLNLDAYTTILVADHAFTQDAIEKIIEEYSKK